MLKLNQVLNEENICKGLRNFESEIPFPFAVIDNFFHNDVARMLEGEFPDYNDEKIWYKYDNFVERKKTSNNWNLFPENTYKIFQFLVSNTFVKLLENNLKNYKRLFSDPGLYGGGWHIQKCGDKLNLHLDNELHIKTKFKRKLNLIVYLNSNWQDNWGGNLGFWENNSSSEPGKLVKSIKPLFNRAIIFDTSLNSWHGISENLRCPENEYRKSLATYYYQKNDSKVTKRFKALFAPTNEQKNDTEVLNFIKLRSSKENASKVYRIKKR